MDLRRLKLKNPYLVAYIAIGVFFLLWMVFLDTHSLLVHQELNKEIENLKKRKDFLESQIEKDNKLITLIEWPELITDKQDIKFIALTFNYLNDLNDRSVNIKV